MPNFVFSFSGDDIEESSCQDRDPLVSSTMDKIVTERSRSESMSAFPIPGHQNLKPRTHSLDALLSFLPTTVAFESIKIVCDDEFEAVIPRRELWDIRFQLMIEEDNKMLNDINQADIKTGVYEGGFKSWESSSDLVKVLHERMIRLNERSSAVLELGCGTALPSLFEFQQQLRRNRTMGTRGNLHLALADYNPSVLQLVTLPNLILSWAQEYKGSLGEEGELEINESLIREFKDSLKSNHITLSFFSGEWSTEFVHLVIENMELDSSNFVLIGAETIYSPFALTKFTEVMLSLLESSSAIQKFALVAAKSFYFGVGGAMTDFYDLIRKNGFRHRLIRKEMQGVVRAVVEVQSPEKW